jgi:hypothetical protein
VLEWAGWGPCVESAVARKAGQGRPQASHGSACQAETGLTHPKASACLSGASLQCACTVSQPWIMWQRLQANPSLTAAPALRSHRGGPGGAV